jgi:FkbH-like protein
MIEIVPGANGVSLLACEASVRAALLELRAAIARRGQITWGEHCSECGYPSCYATCSHYTPRADLHCRRFDDGIESVRVASLGDTLMRIRFRRWGKLQGDGPAPLRLPTSVERHERARSLVGRVADVRVLPHRLRYLVGRLWTKAESARPEGGAPRRADAFVVECISSGDRPTPFTLTLVPKGGSARGQFQERISLGPAYTRVVVPIERIMPQVDITQPFFVQIEPLVEAPPESFVFGLVDLVTWKGAPAEAVVPLRRRPAARAKCIVWDLDDTLWEGTLAEVGVQGVKLRHDVVEVIRGLDARGILHSVASKNDEAEALAALRHFGVDDLFLHPQVSWAPKSESMRRVAQLLDIGIDTLAFVDDQAFERSEVEEAVGCVTTFPATDIQMLPAHALFDGPVTAESAQRRHMYRQEMRRHAAFVDAGSLDYAAFLRASGMRLGLTLITPDLVPRIHDLSQRTNQVNVSGTRYERRAVEDMARAPGSRLPIVMRCEDRFGDYGVVGFVLLDPAAGTVEDYFMSCRVQRKLVENALFSRLAEIAAARGATRLRCRYRRTDRNALSLALLCDLGFRLQETEIGAGWLERTLEPFPCSDVVQVAMDLTRVRRLEVVP